MKIAGVIENQSLLSSSSCKLHPLAEIRVKKSHYRCLFHVTEERGKPLEGE